MQRIIGSANVESGAEDIVAFSAGYQHTFNIGRVGQKRVYTPYMIVNLEVSLPNIPYIHRI